MAPRSERIGYFDFYAGPGRYESGEKSTPLLIIEQAIADPKLAARLVSVFNDADPGHTQSLQAELQALPGYDRLTFEPQIVTGEVDDALVSQFESINTIPALSFIDPWSYNGLLLGLNKSGMDD